MLNQNKYHYLVKSFFSYSDNESAVSKSFKSHSSFKASLIEYLSWGSAHNSF